MDKIYCEHCGKEIKHGICIGDEFYNQIGYEGNLCYDCAEELVEALIRDKYNIVYLLKGYYGDEVKEF